MTISTLRPGLLATDEQTGVSASVLLVVLRLQQGTALASRHSFIQAYRRSTRA
jgi:hypothetical protein